MIFKRLSKPTAFADGGALSGYAKGAAGFMAGKGIIEAADGNRFHPKDKVSWEEALIMALRMLETLK